MKNLKTLSAFISLSVLMIAFQNCGNSNGLTTLSTDNPSESPKDEGLNTRARNFFRMKLIDRHNNNNRVDLVVDLTESKLSVEENEGKRASVDLSADELEEIKTEISQSAKDEDQDLRNHFWQLIRKKRILICPTIAVAEIECLDSEVLVPVNNSGCLAGYTCKPKKAFECPLMPIAYPMCPNDNEPIAIYNENQCLIGYRCE